MAACAPELPEPAGDDTTYGTWCYKSAKCSPADNDGDGCISDRDCDDHDPSRCEFFEETCDGIDNDCDDQVDEEGLGLVPLDADGDGYGDPVAVVEGCTSTAPPPTDCDDSDPDVHPKAEESCNGVDDDCDGAVDEDLPTWADADGDGYGAPDVVLPCDVGVDNADDCDDGDPAEPVVVEYGQSIQAAVDAARGCVAIRAGLYVEDLELGGKDLAITGYPVSSRGVVVEGTGPPPVFRVEDASATVTDVDLTGGAGGLEVGPGGSVELVRVRITHTSGTGAYVEGSLVARQVLFAGNDAVEAEALWVAGPAARAALTHVTVARGSGGPSVRVSGGAEVYVDASLVSGDSSGACFDVDGTLTVTSTDAWGCDPRYAGVGDPTGADGNLSAECAFVDEAAGDYTLASGPCIDALTTTDCEGTPGDMGAFEGESGCW
ncbi:MAG: MopE-related protein [Myxococcota bacterium]